MNNVSDFPSAYKAVRRQMPLVFVISCVVNVLLLTTAIYMLQIYDRVLSSGSYDTLIWLSLVAVFALVMYGLLEYARRTILHRTGIYVDHVLMPLVLRRIILARMAGDTPKASVNHVADLKGYYQSDASLAFQDLPWSFVFIAFIWVLHPALGLFALSGAAILFGVTLLNDMSVRGRQKEAFGRSRADNEAALRLIDSGETIAPLGMIGRLLDRWRLSREQTAAELQVLHERSLTVLSFTRSIRLALQIGILGLGAFQVLNGNITAGAMIAASIVLGRALAPIERVTSAWARRGAAKSAVAVLNEFLPEPGIDAGRPVQLPRPEGRVAVANASFRPMGAEVPTLIDANFAVEPGNICAIIGPSGAGKSTICRLLTGAWAPTAGTVRIDGAKISQWDPDALGAHLGVLPQTVELFPGTIAENIARFTVAESGDIITAAKAAEVHELILSLPQGYETRVGASSDHLSLGQRQRIALARALFGHPAIVVLDEPNSNLDSEGDRALLAAIQRLKGSRATVFVVSHRPEILKASDQVMVVKEGMIAAFGNREDIVKLKPSKQSTKPTRQKAVLSQTNVGG